MNTFTMMYASAPESNHLIGNGLDLPWHGEVPDDMKHFRTYTSGKILLMGRKTADSLGKALPKRLNYVLSRSKEGEENGFHYVRDIQELLESIPKDRRDEEIVVIGGAEIYKHFEPLSDKIMWTDILGKWEGDVHYEMADMSDETWNWNMIGCGDGCEFFELTRIEKFAKLYDTEFGQILITKSQETEDNETFNTIQFRFSYNDMDMTTTKQFAGDDMGLSVRDANFNLMTREKAIDMAKSIMGDFGMPNEKDTLAK